MLERNKTVIKVARLLEVLDPQDRRWVLRELHGMYGRKYEATLSDAERAMRYRARKSRDALVLSSRDDCTGNHVTNGVTETQVSPAPPGTVASSESSLPATTRNGHYRIEAKEVLSFLNVRAMRSYRDVDTNLKLIELRLKSGASVQDCKSVIARKIREWKDDPKMSKFLRPATLFSATKFEQYLGESEPDNA